MTHVFVSPHPDDVALSCGGLIAGLRAQGEPVAIVTIFSGSGDSDRLTPYQRLALGFGRRDERQPGDDTIRPEGAATMDREAAGSETAGQDEPPTPEQVMAVRRAEDEAYARFVGASIRFINLPDAVFRGYEGDAQLMGAPRSDERPPTAELRDAVSRLEPVSLYVPFSIGGHVDHRQARRAAIALLAEPATSYLGRTLFYEDFPYALTVEFERLDQLDPEILPSLPAGVALTPEYLPIGREIDKKLEGLKAYESQLGRLFGGDDPMADAVRRQATRVGDLAGTAPAERYWRATTA